MVLTIAGCGDFFSQKPTEIQAEEIFRELSQVRVIDDVNRSLPEIYTSPPKILKHKDGVKIFYFTKQMQPKLLAGILKEQFKLAPSINESTNQLIIDCKTQDDANMTLEFLELVDVAPIQVRVDCLISELFADLTMDYATESDIANLLGEKLTIEAFLPGASVRAPKVRDPIASKPPAFGMKTGVSRKNFDASIDMLVSRGYAKILMRPTVEVVNGATSRIETKERVPIPILDTENKSDKIVTAFEYQDVIDYLEVTPQVYADGTIGLKVEAGISSRTIPDSVEQAPIITSRLIKNSENRLQKGQSLIIGGIRKTERVSIIRGVPFLKDIPIIGILFSSKDFEDRAKEIIFILTPSISSNGVDHAELVEEIKEKHAKPEYKRGLQDLIFDPFKTKTTDYNTEEYLDQ
jgi:type II secretory pathway component GspD/PulD (secretin)